MATRRTTAASKAADSISIAPPLALTLLRANHWYAEAPPALLEEFARHARVRRYRRGALVAHRGEPLTAVGIIIDGALTASVNTRTGEEFVLSMLPAGSGFGFIGLLDGLPNPVDITAYDDTSLLLMPVGILRHGLDREPALLHALSKAVCHRLRRAYTILEDVVLGSLEQRLSRRLLALAMAVGPHDGPVRLKITQQELSRMVSADRSSVNRELKALEREGVVALHYAHVEVVDIVRLGRRVATQPTYAH